MKRWCVIPGPRRGFTLIELLIVISILVILSVAVAMNFIGFDYDARHSATKANLSAIRSAIGLFRSRHSAFPKPSVSGGRKATQNTENTLEAILTNTNDFGDGSEYIRGNISGELVSNAQETSYVCIITDTAEYYSNQSDYSGCENPSGEDTTPTGNGGGFVYCPTNGNIRLNFTVNGDDLRKEDQSPIQTLVDDWANWAAQHEELDQDWPVRW
ncbi:type II secretion system protein [bacterium]|nr:type II secretion system protein [bacterium]